MKRNMIKPLPMEDQPNVQRAPAGQKLQGRNEEGPVIRLYDSAGAALAKVQASREYWGNTLSNLSFQVSVAVIASELVLIKPDELTNNPFAVGTILFVLFGLVVNLYGSSRLQDMMNEVIEKARNDPGAWSAAYEEFKDKDGDWPFTIEINCWAKWLRWIKAYVPLFAVGLLICAVLYSRYGLS